MGVREKRPGARRGQTILKSCCRWFVIRGSCSKMWPKNMYVRQRTLIRKSPSSPHVLKICPVYEFLPPHAQKIRLCTIDNLCLAYLHTEKKETGLNTSQLPFQKVRSLHVSQVRSSTCSKAWKEKKKLRGAFSSDAGHCKELPVWRCHETRHKKKEIGSKNLALCSFQTSRNNFMRKVFRNLALTYRLLNIARETEQNTSRTIRERFSQKLIGKYNSLQQHLLTVLCQMNKFPWRETYNCEANMRKTNIRPVFVEPESRSDRFHRDYIVLRYAKDLLKTVSASLKTKMRWFFTSLLVCKRVTKTAPAPKIHPNAQILCFSCVKLVWTWKLHGVPDSSNPLLPDFGYAKTPIQNEKYPVPRESHQFLLSPKRSFESANTCGRRLYTDKCFCRDFLMYKNVVRSGLWEWALRFKEK